MAYAGPAYSARVAPSLNNYERASDNLGDIRVRLATGNRIVRNGDDSTSLSSATRLQTQTSTLRSALVSGTRATSFLQVASNGLSQIRTVLETMSELTVTANDTNRTTRQRATLDSQFQSKKAEIDRIVAATTFNGNSILDGSLAGSAAPTVVVGDTSTDTVTLAIDDVSSTALFTGTPNLSSAAAATTATTSVSDAQQAVEDAIAKIDAYQVRLDTAAAAVNQSIAGITRGIESLIGTDREAETNRGDYLRLRLDTAAIVLAQTLGTNQGLLGLLQR